MLENFMKEFDVTHHEIAFTLVFITWYFLYLKYRVQWIITSTTIDHYLTASLD